MPRPAGAGGPPNAKWRQRKKNPSHRSSESNSPTETPDAMNSRSSSVCDRQPTPPNLIEHVQAQFTPEPEPDQEEQGTLSRTYSGSGSAQSGTPKTKTSSESAKNSGSAKRLPENEAKNDAGSSKTPPGSSRKTVHRPVLPLREEEAKQHGHVAVPDVDRESAPSPSLGTLGGSLKSQRAKRAHEELSDHRKNPNLVIPSSTSSSVPPKKRSKSVKRRSSEKGESHQIRNPIIPPESSSSGKNTVLSKAAKKTASSPFPEMEEEPNDSVRHQSESEQSEQTPPTAFRKPQAAPSAGRTGLEVQSAIKIARRPTAIKTIQAVKRVTFVADPREPTPESDVPVPVMLHPSPKQPKRPTLDQRPAAQNRALRKQTTPRHQPVAAEIRRLQHTTDRLIQKAPFARLIREMLVKHAKDQELRVKANALMALQEASEYYLVGFLSDCGACAKHAGRVTIKPKDCGLVRTLRGDFL